MKQVYLISCVKSKQTASPSCRAEEMYISPLYRASLSYALSWADNKSEQVFILSAMHGLLSLDNNITYYEKTLGNMSASERAAWGQKISGRFTERFDLDDTHFVFLAGEKYVAPLRKYIKHYSEPMKGLVGIGNRISWLEKNARNGDKISAPPSAEKPKTPTASRMTSVQKPFADALEQQMEMARNIGAASLTVTSKELHQLVGGYPGPNHKMPACCAAMYSAMREGDIIVAAPPSGKGASLKITYDLNREVHAVISSKSTTAVFVPARDLRSAEALRQVPGDKPGWYRWWASESAVTQLLDSPFVSEKYTTALLPHLWRRKRETADEYYYCMYVGVAIKESIRDRLNWHINQRHTENAVKSGTLSTLRRTLSSLGAGDQYNEAATNAVIDLLVVEYHALDYPIKSELARNEISRIEHSAMGQHIMPLNIMGNRQVVLQPFLADLKKARKASNPHKR